VYSVNNNNNDQGSQAVLVLYKAHNSVTI